MTHRAKLSLLNFSIWFIMFVIFSISFFASTYPEVLPLSNYRTTTAILFLVANFSNVIILYFQYKKERSDERNKRIEALSAIGTMIFIMVLVFLGSITLHVVFADSGLVPISWLWYLGYSTAFMVFIVFNLSYVIVSLKGTGYES
jgi:peptidoglycan biosynthesis protein MviN/MurJ (putative lipid II flippase)